MKITYKTCPKCEKKFSMTAVNEFDGRIWPGSLCKNCGFFVPDVQSKEYVLGCADCGESIGPKFLDYRHHEWTQTSVDAAIKAEQDRADKVKAVLENISNYAKGMKDQDEAKKIQGEVDRHLAAKEHEPRPLKLPEHWEKRHEAELAKYYCLDCHKKRRDAGTDFQADNTHVRHVIKCYVCGKGIAWLDIEEHHSAEEQQEKVERNALSCTDTCQDKAKELRQNKVKIAEEAERIARLDREAAIKKTKDEEDARRAKVS